MVWDQLQVLIYLHPVTQLHLLLPWRGGSKLAATPAVRVKDGKIADVAFLPGTASQENLSAAALLKYGLTHILDFGDLIVSPGLIDTHVHFNEPGREHWEGKWIHNTC